MVKRLFLFAAYNKQNQISDTLIDYLNFISPLGDIVLCFDCDVSQNELKKLKKIKNILHIEFKRHGEYDFGSYKRAYQYAYDKRLLNKYDWVYFVNDSVYCLNLPEHLLTDIESRGDDLIGMVKYKDCQTPEYMQSWFMGISKKIANANFMNDFIKNISKQTNKTDIVLKYEIMFSRIIINHGFKISAVVQNAHDTTIVYKNPYALLNDDVPFIKKKAIQYIGNVNRLVLYAQSTKVVDNIKKDIADNNIKIVSDKYTRVYRLSVFGIPMIEKKLTKDKRSTKYYLFGLPICKTIKDNF